MFVDFPLLKIQKYIKRLKLKYIQLHGKENSNYIKTIKKNYNVKIIKAIGVKNKKDLNLINEIRGVDYFLLDYKKNKKDNLPGGNSKNLIGTFYLISIQQKNVFLLEESKKIILWKQ